MMSHIRVWYHWIDIKRIDTKVRENREKKIKKEKYQIYVQQVVLNLYIQKIDSLLMEEKTNTPSAALTAPIINQMNIMLMSSYHTIERTIDITEIQNRIKFIEEITSKIFSHLQFDSNQSLDINLSNFSRCLADIYNSPAILIGYEFDQYSQKLSDIGRELVNLALD